MENTTDSYSANRSLGVMLHETGGLLRREFERAAAPVGLTMTQWRFLRQAAEHPEGQTQASLCKAIKASPMNVSDVAERLETAGLITRETDPGDSRAKRVRLTRAGEDLLLRMRGIAGGILEKALDGLSQAERDLMKDLLGRVVANLDDNK
jgi:DNA-binding MarR family transcriptional regulator